MLVLAAPAAAQVAPPPLSAYGDLPTVEDAAVSPSGKHVALVIFSGGQQILIMINEQHQVANQISLGDAKLRGISWFGDDAVLVESSQTERLPEGFTTTHHEFYIGHIIPMNGGEPQVVFGKDREIMNSIWGQYGVRRIGGKWKGYFGGLHLSGTDGDGYGLEDGNVGLYQVDLQSNKSKRVASANLQNHSLDWLVNGAGEVVATLDISQIDGGWFIANSHGDKIATGSQETGAVSLICLGKDGTTAIYTAYDSATHTNRWYEVPLAGGKAQEIFSDLAFQRIYVDRGNGQLMGYLPDREDAKPVFFDAAKQAAAEQIFKAFPGRNLRMIEWSDDFGEVLVRTSGSGDSGSWYLIDLSQMQPLRLGQERAQIPAAEVGPISTFSYTAQDGLALDGILTLPPGREAKNLPVIMLPHGGPAAYDDESFDWWAQAFASRGYAVFQPNFRGSTNRDEAFQEAGNGQWGRKMQTDISDGLAALAKAGIVDPARACIMGASYGGYAALAGVTLQHGIYKCAVAVAGVSDVKLMYDTDYRQSGQDHLLRTWQLEELGDPKTFDEISPRKHVDAVDVPILLIHGRDDTVVPFDQSAKMADALKDAGKPYQFVVLDGEDHWLSRAATRNQMLQAAMDFVLKNDPPN